MKRQKLFNDMAEALQQNQPHEFFMPDPLQPTASFLDYANRDVRRHFCILNDVEGDSFFLRPDFTLPICLHYKERGTRKPLRFFYHGDVWLWNQETGQRRQQAQMGVEHIGRGDQAQATADVISATYLALKKAGYDKLYLKMGDPGLFDRLIDTLALPEMWQAQLKKRFRRNAGLALFFEQAQKTMRTQRQNNSHIQSVAELEKFLQKNNIRHIGQRRLEEIVERVSEQSALTKPDLPTQALQIIRDFLNLPQQPTEPALAAIAAFAHTHKLALDDELNEIQARFDALKKTTLAEILATNQAIFSTHFQGAHLNYYTGFVFAFLPSAKAALPLAGGGHYNGLMRQLGVADGTGIGTTLYLDEIIPDA